MALGQSLVRLFPLSFQRQQWTASSSNRGAAARQRTPPSSPSALKPRNATWLFEKIFRLRGRRTDSFRSGWRKAEPVRASSSAGTLVSDWGEGDEEGWNVEAGESDVRREHEKKKGRLIAGVDQTQLLEPHLLADPDSRFVEFYDVQIHHKIARPSVVSDVHSSSAASSPSVADVGEQRVKLPAILLHGFGASLFSWERIMPKLAEAFGAPALAFDRPAFGYTSRPSPPASSPSSATKKSLEKYKNAYTITFSAAATLAFVDFLNSDQAILIGHSAGSLVAVDAYFQSPEKIAALILVAPAVLAPLLVQQIAASKEATRKESAEATKKEMELEEEVKNDRANPLSKFSAALLWIWMKFTTILRTTKKLIQLVLSKLLGFLFRSPPAVWVIQRIMDKGGPWAVRYAFYDVVKADQYVLDGYTRPLRCRGWERALLEYCLALMDNTEEQASGKKKLEDVRCPVLVVTGDTDRIVPDWNAENLAKVFPNAEFKRIKNCGHLPHEETPDEFLEIIKDWLSRNLIRKTNPLEPALS